MSVKHQAHPSHPINHDGVVGEVVLIIQFPDHSLAGSSQNTYPVSPQDLICLICRITSQPANENIYAF